MPSLPPAALLPMEQLSVLPWCFLSAPDFIPDPTARAFTLDGSGEGWILGHSHKLCDASLGITHPTGQGNRAWNSSLSAKPLPGAQGLLLLVSEHFDDPHCPYE